MPPRKVIIFSGCGKNVEMTKTIFTLTAMTAFIVSRSLRQDHLKVFLRVLLYVCRELVCVIFHSE